MAKLKISFSNIIDVEHLESMAKIHGYKPMVKNPDFNEKEKESESNPAEIPSKVSAVDFAISKLASMTGEIVTHEVTYPIMDDLSPKDLQAKKQEVMDELKANFELKVEEV